MNSTVVPLAERQALKKLRNDMSKSWSLLFSVPGLPLKTSSHRRAVIGGPVFWLIVGSFYLMVYAIIFEYAIVVVFFRLLIAVVMTLIWMVAATIQRLKYR